MRPWLLPLLLSLLVSDLSPLRDGLMETWTLSRKVPLSGLKPFHLQRGSCSMCIQRDSEHKLQTWVCEGQRGRLSEQKFKEKLLRNQTPALVVSLLSAKRRSVAALTDQHVVEDVAGGIPTRPIKALPYSAQSACFLHHHSAAAPGCSFKAFLLEKSKNWAPATSLWLQKVLTKRYGDAAAETLVISCCLKESEGKGAASIKKSSKNQSVEGRVREMHDGQPDSKGFLNRYDTFKAAALSSSGKKKKRKRLSVLLQSAVQRQRSLKVSSVHNDDDDGFYIKRELLLAPREKPGSINNPEYKIKVSPDDNKEKFSWKIITKQAELQRPQGESAAERSHKNIENGNQERLTYRLQAGFTHKTDNNDDRGMLSEVGDDILIRFFLPDAERATQTDRKPIPHADVKLETVNRATKEADDPPPIAANLITEARKSECKHLRGMLFLLVMFAADKGTTKSAKSEEEVRRRAERMVRPKVWSNNRSINRRQQEASPPSTTTTTTTSELETHREETSSVNTDIKETTPTRFNQHTSDEPPRFERFITRRAEINVETTAEESHSGLRMRETFSFRFLRGKQAVTRRPEKEREREERGENQTEDPLQTTQKQTTTQTPLTKHEDMPPCRGLFHRSEAGWRRCVQRYSGAGSEMFSSGEPAAGAFKDTGERRKDDASIREHADSDDDEYDHFYYFDGVMKRVRNNFYPQYKRQRLRRRSDNTERDTFTEEEKGESQQNLLSHIRHLSSRNKDSQQER